jgi:serine/threonine protein kinase
LDEVADLPDEDSRPSRPRLLSRVSSASATSLTPGTMVGEYELGEQIGEGAMGTVYQAVQPLIGKQCAIKVLKLELCANQASLDRFVQEAQAVNKIGHPNIVDVFSLGELEDGRAYFVMELLRGEDLKSRLARGPVAIADACEILDGIARALEAAHGKDIVHRDLKPDNVYLHRVEDGPLMVKLLDFGIAKLVRSTPGAEKTQTGNMLGTPRYISPESARGVHIDHRADIYSLGALAYEMLAGRPPFQGDTAMDLVVAHMNEPPPPLSQFAKVPKALEQVVMRMLEKDPANRPTLDDFRSILADPAHPGRRLTPLPSRLNTQPRATGRTPKWPIALAAVAAAGIGVATWKLVGGSSSEAAKPPPVQPVAAPVAVPPPPPPPVPERGTLSVNVTGAKDAVIVVDGTDRGHGTSVRIELDAGHHDVTVKPPGRVPISQGVDLTAGDTSSVTVVVPPVTVVHTPARPPKHKPPAKPAPVHDDDALLRPGSHH